MIIVVHVLIRCYVSLEISQDVHVYEMLTQTSKIKVNKNILSQFASFFFGGRDICATQVLILFSSESCDLRLL